MAEEVNHPDHYGGDTPYETIKVLQAWLTPEQFVGFCRGNALKYLSRAGKKGALKTNLEKARFYQEYEIKTYRPLRAVMVNVNGETIALSPDDVRFVYEDLPVINIAHSTSVKEEILESQLSLAKGLLQEIATRPTEERNPDGEDQAAHTMKLIAQEGLKRLG